jgi:hypothetical protein
MNIKYEWVFTIKIGYGGKRLKESQQKYDLPDLEI